MEMVRLQSPNYKRTIVFRIANQFGAFCRALQPFASRGVDIAKIDSRPAKRSRFEYVFYLDLVGTADFDQMYEATMLLRRVMWPGSEVPMNTFTRRV